MPVRFLLFLFLFLLSPTALAQVRPLDLVPAGEPRTLPERILGASAEPFWDDFHPRSGEDGSDQVVAPGIHAISRRLAEQLLRLETRAVLRPCGGEPLALLREVRHAVELRSPQVAPRHLPGAVQGVQRQYRRRGRDGPELGDGIGRRPGGVVQAPVREGSRAQARRTRE